MGVGSTLGVSFFGSGAFAWPQPNTAPTDKAPIKIFQLFIEVSSRKVAARYVPTNTPSAQEGSPWLVKKVSQLTPPFDLRQAPRLFRPVGRDQPLDDYHSRDDFYKTQGCPNTPRKPVGLQNSGARRAYPHVFMQPRVLTRWRSGARDGAYVDVTESGDSWWPSSSGGSGRNSRWPVLATIS